MFWYLWIGCKWPRLGLHNYPTPFFAPSPLFFTASKVYWIRYANQLPSGCPEAPGACSTVQRGDGRYSTKAVAELLNVNVSTVSNWCEAGRLDCIRANPRGPRWIKLTPEIIQKLRKPAHQRRSQRLSDN